MSGALGGLLGVVGLSAAAGVLVTVAVTPALAVTGIAANSSISMFENLPDYLAIDDLAQKSTIWATNPVDGSQLALASFYEQDREEVAWDAVSQTVKDAAIAAEDPRFYEHGGVDLAGTIRGALVTMTGKDVQGGSSITQQYVKNVLINNGVSQATTEEEQDAAYEAATETTPERKLKEIRYAIALEKQYSKDEILLGYLNIAGFGGRVYGIQAAAQYYYGVNASDLNLTQATSLLAIVNNPDNLRLDQPDSERNGINSVNADGEVVPYLRNKDRRDYILDRMLEYGKITQAQRDEAVATPVTPDIHPSSTGCQTAGASGYFCDYVTQVIKNQMDDPETEINEGVQLLQRGGLDIYTTIDLNLQDAADRTMRENVPYVDGRFDVGSVAVSVEVGTGRVLAMTQNKNYSQDQEVLDSDRGFSAINYSTDFDYGGSMGFQPGSTFKVFTLAEWLNEGHSLLESFNGSRKSISNFPGACSGGTYVVAGGFNPRNDDSTTANNAVGATKYSVNSSFMQMASQVQLCGIKNTAEAFGVKRADGNELGKPVSDPENNEFAPSDVLGTQEVSPLSMVNAFAGIANNGTTCSPIPIDRIVGPDGNEIAAPKSTCTQSVAPEVAHAMDYAMAQVFAGDGTASASNTGSGVPHIGKTGTTDGAKDTWMIGASTRVATGVWVGNVTGEANLRDLRFDSGAAATARHRMWPAIMSVADQKYGGDAFPDAPSSAFRQVLVDLPNLAGLTLDQARQALEEAGFQFADGGQRDSDLPVGQVMASEPSGQAGRGSVVTVFTSNGKLKVLPNVVGQSLQQATSTLTAAGFSVTGTGNGTVTAMSPAAGTPVAPGTVVTLTVGGGGNGNGNGNQGNDG